VIPVVIDTNVFVAGLRSGDAYQDVQGRPIWTGELMEELGTPAIAACAKSSSEAGPSRR
jgi:hypothetical protein